MAGGAVTLEINKAILGKNAERAAANRQVFQEYGLYVLNVLSAPGSGKTAFLERTLRDLGARPRAAVIVGDLATDKDGQRLARTGAPVVQLTTGNICHLEAGMIARALPELPLSELDLLIVENVGNLVCPAGYDLGENCRVVLFSVTEGEDKPLKYPTIFRSANAIVINKVDLARAVDFDRALALRNLAAVAPGVRILEVSARTGAGMSVWYDWLRATMHCGLGMPCPVPASPSGG